MKYIYSILILLSSQGIYAQVDPVDSMAVVDFYNGTNGYAWFNNSNWLTAAPMDTWYGITILNHRVDRIELANNNLTGALPANMVSLLEIDVIDIENNHVEDLSYLGGGLDASLINVRMNSLCFDDLELNAFIQSTIWYDPQRTIGIDTMLSVNNGADYTLDVHCGGFDNRYQWYKDGVPIGPLSTNSSFTLMNLPLTGSGNYHCEVTSIAVPGMSIFSRVTTINVLPCQDSLGGEYICNQLIVHFDPSTSNSTRELKRIQYGGTLIDSCMCREFEIWEFPDSVDLEPRRGDISEDSDTEGSDFNYIVTLDDDFQADPLANIPTLPGPPFSPNPVVVAIIDSGIGYNHPSLQNRIWKNTEETVPNSDDDMNCLEDDNFGWDFVLESNIADDDNGHGTFIAGIITDNGTVDNAIQLMNLKAFSSDSGNLFDILCALKYGETKGAQIYNLSFGYYGEASSIMENLMSSATLPGGCKPIYVASAGNNTNDNDLIEHYPSNYNLDNLIAVAATNSTGSHLASFSNWGENTVDLAAKGQGIVSTVPPDGMAVSEGTSYAAPHVVRNIAEIYVNNPGYSYRGAKSSIVNTIAEMTTWADSLQISGQLNAAGSLIHAPTGGASYFDCAPRLEISVLLEGPYEIATGMMHDSLRIQMHLPLAQPFNVAPWNYAGAEVSSPLVMNMAGTSAVVDWVLLMAFDTIAGDTLRKACLVQKDGNLIEANGNPVILNAERDLQIAIIHRNHLAIQSEDLISFSTQPTKINFIDGSIALGTSGYKVIGTDQVMIAGDANGDGLINMSDYWAWVIANGSPFIPIINRADFNMDGSINATDKYDYLLPNLPSSSLCVPCYD